MCDLEAVDSELGLLLAIRKMAREAKGGTPCADRRAAGRALVGADGCAAGRALAGRCRTAGVKWAAMANPGHLEHLDELRRVEGFPHTNEDSAVSAVGRDFADRGVLCTRDEARLNVREGMFNCG